MTTTRIEPLDTIFDEEAAWEVAKLRVQMPRKGEHWLLNATKRAIMVRAAMDVLKFALLSQLHSSWDAWLSQWYSHDER